MRQHFEALDGLRGVAALAVLTYHTSLPFGVTWLAPRGYLAVDFFFALSGFVIAEAYGRRLQDDMSLLDFASVRVRRLWPLLALGAVLGAAAMLVKWKLTGAPEPGLIALATVLCLLLIPSRLPVDGGMAYPFNIVEWSLLYEAVVNVLYATTARFLSVTALIAAVCLSSVVLVSLTYWHGTLDLGSSLDGWPFGLARALFSFSAGVLIHRLRPNVRLPFPVICGLLVAAFCAPLPFPAWTIDLSTVMLISPLVVAAGAQARGVRLSRLAGRMSYPLYAVHYPFVLFFSYLARAAHSHGTMLGLLMVTEAVTVLVAAYLAMRLIDDRALFRPFIRSLPVAAE